MEQRCSQTESLVIEAEFWRGRRIFLTGHTGFKGGWTSTLLSVMGARVFGLALPPEHRDGVFNASEVEKDVDHRLGDIRNLDCVFSAMQEARPEIVIHMAAQPLVRLSYAEPVETYATNVMGTVHVLEAIRRCPSVRAAVIVTSDKAYENDGRMQGYRETDPVGGHDPYSNSKGCAELVTASYRRSFFCRADDAAIASVRAGNVIGGGDWARDRLIPDAVRAFSSGETLRIRFPAAVRPWQHVFDPIVGYLRLAEHLVRHGQSYASGWNFGPAPDSHVPVRQVVERLAHHWGEPVSWAIDGGEQPHEAGHLQLDCAKARDQLGWQPSVDFDEAIRLTVDWYRAAGADRRATTLRQIDWLFERHRAMALQEAGA
jgi:CDP-glucose 4,6-dehydratase